MGNSFVVHIRTCMFHTCTNCLFLFCEVAPRVTELRISQGPSTEDTGGFWRRPTLGRGWLQPPTAAAPREASLRPRCLAPHQSEPWRAKRVLSEKASGGENQERTQSWDVSRKKSKVMQTCQPHCLEPCTEQAQPRWQRLGGPRGPHCCPDSPLHTRVCICVCVHMCMCVHSMSFPGGSGIEDPPATWETWVQSLGWEDPLEEGLATTSSILAWRIPIDRGAWRATVHRVTKSQTCVCVYTYIHVLLQILFLCGLLQDTESSSLCCAVGPCWLSVI